MNTEIKNIKNILLVEDDPRDAELTLAALEEHHLANRVTIVCDGAEALDYLYHRGAFETRGGGDPVLVLLDLNVPKVNGLEVLKIIKADEYLRLIPVVVLSSSREMPDRVECYKHGVNAYVVKPVDFGDFTKAVKQLGVFWVAVNEPPPHRGRKETSIQNGEVTFPAGVADLPRRRASTAGANAADGQTHAGTMPPQLLMQHTAARQRPGKEEVKNEFLASRPAPGR